MPDLLIAVEVRFELAEMFAEREEINPAITLLKEAIDKEPSDKQPTQELTDKMRIRTRCVSCREEGVQGSHREIRGCGK